MTAGKPLANIQVYILDQNLQFLPTGHKGEIFIGGMGLARGYLNNQILTDEKFLRVTFADTPPMRLYKTGDFGRFLLNGDLEFLGRVDNQVKIRGHRIELGEIEYVICQYPEIKEAAVAIRENNPDNKQLVACFSAPTQIATESLRTYLSHLLPNHMIPSSFIQLKHFPLTPNGKIDRKALLNLPEFKTVNRDCVQPQSELEQILLEIWKKVLQRETIGIHDNFFDIGGDSLHIANVQASIDTTLSLEVSIVDLFHYPTIFQLAQHIGRQEKVRIPQPNILSKNQGIVDKRKAAFQWLKKQHKN